MKPKEAEKIVGSLKNKKAKSKSIDAEVTGTKSTKLSKKIRDSLETALGADLSKVQIHVGGNVGDICKTLKVKAFTNGSNIYFAKGGDSKNGNLIAHELTHVVQQSKGRMPKPQKGKVLVSK